MTRNQSQKFKLPVRKLKKDPGVPKLPSLKVRNEVKKQVMRTRPVPQRRHDAEDTPMATEKSLSALAASISGPSDPTRYESNRDSVLAQAKRQYIRTLHRVIEQSDIIILVLDARDPEGCRSKLVEDEVRRRESEGKTLVFVLNKIDLVPQDNALAWLRYLKHTAPTIPFRSSTQQQSTNLKSRSSPAMMNLLKSYKSGPSSSITVGVVGYPNVGKSSLINTLKRSKVCAVASEAGWTRDLQSVQIERGFRIIDSPGVVFDDDDLANAQARSGVLLRNVVKVEDVEDPLAVVEEIFARTEKETLQKIYKLQDWTTMLEFLTMLALTSGRLLKGGTPDLVSTARVILKDWNANKIPYFSVPPVVHPSSMPSNAPGAENVGETSIVQGGFSAAFNLGELYGDAMQQDDDVPQEGVGAMEEDGNEMESDDLRPVIPRKRSRSLTPETDRPSQAVSRDISASSSYNLNGERAAQAVPPPAKRTKPTTYDITLDAHEREMMASANPLGRKSAKANLKRVRKAARRAARTRGQEMVVDDVGEAVEFTFRLPGS